MLLTILHPELATQKTFTTAEVAAAATTTYVENNDDFASGDLVLFGLYGQERTEKVVLTNTTGSNQLDHSTGPEFPHPARTPVSQMMYDQAEISRADSQGGSYSVLTTIDLNFDEEYTLYNDSNGTTSSWYKIRYKNSQSASYSSYSDEIQGTGYEDDALGSMVEEVLTDFGDPTAKKVTRDRVKGFLKAEVRTLTLAIIKTYPDYLKNYTTQSLTANTQTYTLPSYFLGFVRVDVNYAGTDTTNARKAIYEGEDKGLPTTTYTSQTPRVFIRGGSFGLRPTPTTTGGLAFIWYWAYPTPMNSDSDLHGLPFGARDVLVAGSLYKLWLSKNQDTAKGYKTLYQDLKEEFIEFVGQQRQQITKPYQETVSGADLYDDTWF